MKRFLLLLLLATSVLLNACATRTISDQEIAALAVHDRRSTEEIATDIDIETDINSELKDEEELLSQSHINTSVYNGAVLVTGETPDEETRTKIIAIIQVIKHVKMVHDNLVIGAPSSIDSRNNDAGIHERVTTALTQIRTIPDFEPSMVKVSVENATVYLMGRVHRNEGIVVINVVRHQPDIKQITTIFEYLD